MTANKLCLHNNNQVNIFYPMWSSVLLLFILFFSSAVMSLMPHTKIGISNIGDNYFPFIFVYQLFILSHILFCFILRSYFSWTCFCFSWNLRLLFIFSYWATKSIPHLFPKSSKFFQILTFFCTMLLSYIESILLRSNWLPDQIWKD